MTIRNQHGFTIIELMLFLAVSASLFAALMVGVNANIVQQQYRDSVMEYSGLLQQQYSEVANTLNERDDNWICESSQIEDVEAAGEPRGTSECVIMGRYVQVIDDGSAVQVGSIVGSRPAGSGELQSDTEAIVAYSPRVSPVDTKTQPITWRSTLKNTDGAASTGSFVIIRSPLSGLIRVYNSTASMPANLSTALTDDASRLTIKTCVVAADSMSGPVYSVSVNPAIAGPNGVISKVDSNDPNGDGAQC